jgi:acetyltransferase-like isoleucine patch superfamily enzyme
LRKISFSQILVFTAFLAAALGLGVGATASTVGLVPLGEFRGLTFVAVDIIFTYLFAFILFRLFLRFARFQAGEIEPRSRQEFIYHVYLLFFLILFYPLMRSGFVPVPLMRLVYLALGARLGKNTYSSGIILDPPFVAIGDNTLIGQYATLIPHVIENKNLAHYEIRIGSNVTVGAHAVVLAGVTIGDNALVATGAIVSKGTQIGEGERWGGVPARLLHSKP